jgi:hypothetical protein
VVPLHNRFDLSQADHKSVYDDKLPEHSQGLSEIYDAAIDFYVDYAANIGGGEDFRAIRVSESRAIALCDPRTEKRPDKRITVAAKKGLFVPCTLRPRHWSLVVINLPNNEIHLLDSLYEPTLDMIDEVRKIVLGLSFYYEIDGLEDAELLVWHTHCFQGDDGNLNYVAPFCLVFLPSNRTRTRLGPQH